MIRGLFTMKVMRHEELRRGGCLGDGDFRPRMLDKAEEALQGLLGICFWREAPETAIGRTGLPVEAS